MGTQWAHYGHAMGTSGAQNGHTMGTQQAGWARNARATQRAHGEENAFAQQSLSEHRKPFKHHS